MTREELIAEAKRRYHPIREGDWFEGNHMVTHNPQVHPNIEEWAVCRLNVIGDGDTIYSMPPGKGGYVVLSSGNWATKRSIQPEHKQQTMKYYKLKDSVGRGDYPEYKRDRSYCETEKIREGGITVGELALTYPSDWEEVGGSKTSTEKSEGTVISYGFQCRLCKEDVSIEGDPFHKWPPLIPICDYCISSLGSVVKREEGPQLDEKTSIDSDKLTGGGPLTSTDKTEGQLIVKQSEVDGDADWEDPSKLDPNDFLGDGSELNPYAIKKSNLDPNDMVSEIREESSEAKKHYDRGFQDGMLKANESPFRVVLLSPLDDFHKEVLNNVIYLIHHSTTLEDLWWDVLQGTEISYIYDFTEKPMYLKMYREGDKSIDFMSGYGHGVVFRVEEKK